MDVRPLADFVCPLDGELLISTAAGARCSAGHAFDRAREGYMNLLPVQHKASRDPGDDQIMVTARRRILDDGLFAPVSSAVFALVRDFATRTDNGKAVRIVDAGCGEGYYLAQLIAAAQGWDQAITLELAGYDISKWAVRAAARRSEAVAWAVASNRQPPFAAASLDLILSLFGFAQWPQFEALLTPRGCVLVVEAGARHLLELRELIYPWVEANAPALPRAALLRGWHLGVEQHLEYTVSLDSPAQIQALLAMTPHAHRMSTAGRAAVEQLASARVTVNVVLREMLPPVRDPARP